MIKSIHLFLFILIINIPGLMAQDAAYSQWYSNLVNLNPANAGVSGHTRLNVFYRKQWPAHSAGFSAYGAAADFSVAKYNLGWGVIITNNRNAAFIKPSMHLVYAYHIVSNHGFHINFGLKTGFIQEYLLTSELTFENPETISSGFSRFRLDFGSGISFYSSNVFGGFAVDHLNKPRQGNILTGEIRLNRKYTGNLGIIINLPSRLKSNSYQLMPTVIFQQFGAQQNLQLGVLSQVNQILTGLWIKKNLTTDAPSIIFLLGYKTLNTRFAYSCDININLKMLKGYGAHEISITRLLPVRTKKLQKTISCPSFLQ